MNPTLSVIIHYVEQSLVQTGQQLLLVLGPLLLLAVIIQQITSYVRSRFAQTVGVGFYVYLTAIGVMVHELGHVFFCVLFGHRIVRMRLFSPHSDGSLGVVEHAYNRRSIYQNIGNFFIGTGPIWFGTAIIYLLARYFLGLTSPAADNAPLDLTAMLSHVALSAWDLLRSLAQPAMLHSWRFWAFAYVAFCIGSHITLSEPDIAGAWRGFSALIAFLITFNLLTYWFAGAYSAAICAKIIAASGVFYGAMVFVIGLNLAAAVAGFVLGSFGR